MGIIDGIPAGNQTWMGPLRTKLGRFLIGKKSPTSFLNG